MGLSWSKRHHHRHNQPQIPHHHHHQQQDQPPPTYSTSSQPPPPPPQQPQPPPQPSYSFAANSPYPTPQPQNTYLSPPPPPHPLPPPPPYHQFNYQRPLVTHPIYHPYFIPPPNLWGPFRPPHPFPPPGLLPPPLPAVPYVDHQTAKKIKNDVNVRKETIKLVADEENPDCHLVSFTFDAMVDGSITVMYFGKEGENCSFTSVYSEMVPVKIPFQTGIGQKFSQPPGNGIDLGFFDIDDLSKPSQGDVFPLVILAESTEPSTSLGVQTDGQIPKAAPSHAQITLAILQQSKESQFEVKVIKQILWIDGIRYELREIYGINNSGEEAVTHQDKECVICMTDPKDTTVLPCRHMCLCSACAKELRLQSNKCPICRQPIQELLEIKIDEE